MTLTEFLLARLEEDERGLDAPAFMEADSVRGPGWGDRGDCPICGKYQFDGTESATEDAWYEHVDQAHQRTRVLAECEAKRRIVDAAHADYEDSLESGDDTTGLAEEVLRALALPYSDHPDYDEAWRP